MNKERFYQLIETCMKQNDVREAVLENHDNNRWWPDDVRDRRKRSSSIANDQNELYEI